MTQQAWADWAILQDLPKEASVSIAELKPETLRDLEPGEIDDQSVTGSVASQKHDESGAQSAGDASCRVHESNG